ncbi:glycine zipper 2TM domain-containing protein [Cognatilysobacter bugurensis]|uniref:Membrane protein n=1 Tax=Cognatilysobacter bugurensis TaxID=543356 RepID=A0A918STS0_9GAMM|nr:glycine zipper 2TM domain-containing protein [Lysobacter bugurensis]GHA70675.1 membrane protein [Lysobacter bugurensis]
MDKNIIAVAVASMLVGGVAVAAYDSFRTPSTGASPLVTAAPAPAVQGAPLDMAQTNLIDPRVATQPETPSIEYADIVEVDPVREQRPLYATVIATDPVRETSTTSVPREVCEDVVVQDRMPERDGNVGGTVAGALIGGLVGNQVGGGNGKKVATAAGAVAGGFVGNRVDRNHVGGQVVTRTDRQCRTVYSDSKSSRVVGYNVTYRNSDGTTGTMQMASRPGNRVRLGSEDHVVGYDVSYRYQGRVDTVRLDDRPGPRLPVIDGQVVTQTAAAFEPAPRG